MLLQQAYCSKRKRFCIPEGHHVHFDIPLTLGHETDLLYQAGFSSVLPVDSIEGASILLARKSNT